MSAYEKRYKEQFYLLILADDDLVDVTDESLRK